MNYFESTKVIELGSTAFRQWRAAHSHCSKLHGYQLKAKIWFGSSSLDDKNWVVDFGGLKELKNKLQHVFDHTTTVAADDPELETFKELDRKGIIQLRVFENGVGVERCAELVFNITQEYINHLTQGRCWVHKVEVFEHQDNSATYTKGIDVVTSVDEPEVSEVETVQPKQQPHVGRPASIGNNVTQGKGNWFSGTSWG